MKENSMWLNHTERVQCRLVKAECPLHHKGHRYMGKNKCNRCPNAFLYTMRKHGYMTLVGPYTKEAIQNLELEAPTKCPHCDGQISKADKYSSWDYDCKRCRRAWIVFMGHWLAGFDAGGSVYKHEDGKFTRLRNEESEKVWDKWRAASNNNT